MALPRITQKEMTEREQRELKTLLDRARIAHGRVLTNSETNSIKKEYIDKLMVEREAEAKKARQLKKKQAYKLKRHLAGQQIRRRAAGANEQSTPEIFTRLCGHNLPLTLTLSPKGRGDCPSTFWTFSSV